MNTDRRRRRRGSRSVLAQIEDMERRIEGMTRGRRGGSSLLAKMDDLDRRIEAMDDADAKLLSEAEALAKEEVKDVTTRGETDVFEDIGDENARANDNWPMEGSERDAVAAKLVALAGKLLDD